MASLLHDETFQMMDSGSLQWGDIDAGVLIPLEAAASESPKPPTTPRLSCSSVAEVRRRTPVLLLPSPTLSATPCPESGSSPALQPRSSPSASPMSLYRATADSFDGEDEDDRDWTCPPMVLRKHIWGNFPVTVIPLDTDASGAERHSIQWHLGNLMAERDDPCFEDYVARTERRLIKALSSSSKWELMPAETETWIATDPRNMSCMLSVKKEICIIRMVFASSEERVAEERVAEVQVKPTAGPKPELKNLYDIKARFHVCWDNKTTGNPNIYTIKVHGDRTRAAGLDVKQHGADLQAALKLSSTLRVLPALKDELCRIELPEKN